MSCISFITNCIEQYSQAKSMAGNEVYKLFKENGILTFLEQDYEDLHGCGFEYLIRLIDQLLENRK
jgi:hypothetical protein